MRVAISVERRGCRSVSGATFKRSVVLSEKSPILDRAWEYAKAPQLRTVSRGAIIPQSLRVTPAHNRLAVRSLAAGVGVDKFRPSLAQYDDAIRG